MALLFCDNFENWTSTSSNYPGPWLLAGNIIAGSSSNINSRIADVFATSTGGSTNSHLHIGFASASEFVVNFKVSIGTAGGSGAKLFVWFLDGGTIQCGLGFKDNGRFAVYRGATTELIQGTNSYPFDSANFLDVEWKINIHNTTGSTEVRVNGVEEIAPTGSLNTRSSANNSADIFRIGSQQSGIAVPNYKHVILMDTAGSVMNDFIGPVAISSLRPSADGNYTTWTPNTGTRWDAVNDAITDSDTTYVTANTATDKVSFGMTDLPAGVTDVFGVMAQAQIKREAETTRIAQMFVRAGGTDQAIGTAQGVGPSYAFRNAVATVNPHTAAAWTPAEINALELGMEITT
jgi:hypothetical protein